jgi:hypothetical protein
MPRHLQLPGNNVPWHMVYHRLTRCLKKILTTREMLLVLKWQHIGSSILGISSCTAWNLGTRRCSLCTHSTQNLQGRLWRLEGLKICASLSLSPMEATLKDMGQGYLHRPYIWPSPSYRPSSHQGGGPQGLTWSTNVGDQGKPRRVYLDDSWDQSAITN